VIILQFQGGLLQAPLNPLKADVSRGPPGLSGWPGPLGPHRNSTTGARLVQLTGAPRVQTSVSAAVYGQHHQPNAKLPVSAVNHYHSQEIIGSDTIRTTCSVISRLCVVLFSLCIHILWKKNREILTPWPYLTHTLTAISLEFRH